MGTFEVRGLAPPGQEGRICATKKISRSVISGADGVVGQASTKTLKGSFAIFLAHHPASLVREAARNLLKRSVRPSWPGGARRSRTGITQ